MWDWARMSNDTSMKDKPEKRKPGKKNVRKQTPPTPKRDNFSAATRQRLRDMAGNVCSFPECYRVTHGAKSERTGSFSIGVACHIKAAAPGGPRYDPYQTKEERKHPDNGIWMCQTHSKLVDADDSPYTVEGLQEWKSAAEVRSNRLVNQRMFTEQESMTNARKESARMLQTFVSKGENPVDTPITEIVKGYELALSELDSRFTVKADLENGILHHTISPASPDASFKIHIKNPNELEGYLENEQAWIEEGRPITIDSPHYSVSGSKLFEAFHQEAHQSSITISGKSSKIRTLLYAFNGSADHFIAEYESHSTFGTKRIVTDGACLGGFLITHFTHDTETKSSRVELSFDLSAWEGRDITKLPYFPRLLKAIPPLTNGHFVVEFEIGEKNDQIRHKLERILR